MYGLKITNNSGDILISDRFPNLHFRNKARYDSVEGWNNETITNYSGTNKYLNGTAVASYTTWTNLSSSGEIGYPVIFIKPNNYNHSYAILEQRMVSSNSSYATWEVKVFIVHATRGDVADIVSSDIPELYTFVKPEHITNTSLDSYGLVVKDSNQNVTFDSRKSPLAVLDTVEGRSPDCPVNSGYPETNGGYGWKYTSLDWDMSTTDQYTAYSHSAQSSSSLMFHATSTAQAVYKRQMEGYKKSCGGTYGGSCQEHWSTAAWWCMYRQAIKVQNNNVIMGWGVFASSYYFSYAAEGNSWYAGGASSFSWSSGSMPYSPKTINNSQNVVCILADSSIYD